MPIKVTAEQQLHFLENDIFPLLMSIDEGFTYDPGHSDLDDEQPIHVVLSLGDYRRAMRLLHELKKNV